jgi:hypothetical protein
MPRADARWVVSETVGRVYVGTVLGTTLPPGAVDIGDFGVCRYLGEVVPVRNAKALGAGGLRARSRDDGGDKGYAALARAAGFGNEDGPGGAALGGDYRGLPLKRDARSRQFRDFKDIVDTASDPNREDWVVESPATVSFCVQHMFEHGGTPLAHHGRFVAEGRLQPGDAGIAAHEVICRALQVAVQYDQLQVTQLASFEILMRLLQMTQMKYRERFLGSTVGNGGGGKKGGGHQPYLVEDDMHLYLGTSATRGRLCISPKLTEHVSTKQGAEASLYKERRKLMEERRLMKANNPKGDQEA